MRLTRRQFIAVTAGAAAGAAIPQAVAKWVGQAALADSATMYFLTDATRAATCAAACARIVPTGADPATDPGAAEADAVVFIDRFLAAFELQADGAADGAPVWLSGPFSNRNPYPVNYQDPSQETGQPSTQVPPDSFYSGGRLHTLPMTSSQAIVWKSQLYGYSALTGGDPTWVSQVRSGAIPGVQEKGLRQIYRDGLDALNDYSITVTGQPFASAPREEQDAMLAVVGNVLLTAVLPPVTGGLSPLTSQLPVPLPTPPSAAQELFPYLVTHTFQGCYGLPEYREQDANPLWAMIGYDGDTQPLGNSIYGSELRGDNDGFGVDPATGDQVYPITGGYHEYRPVSHISDEDDSALTPAQAQQMVQFLRKAQSR